MRSFNLFKIILFFGFCIIFLFLFKDKSHAADFTHEINANYEINESGEAQVTYEFQTTNKIQNNYLKSFELQLPFEPSAINISESSTPIKIKELNRANAISNYKLNIEFANPVIGINRKYEWQFSFIIKDIIIPHGMQKALIIPTFAEEESFLTYNISVKYPKKLGKIQYIYGNVGIQDKDEFLYLNFVSTTNPSESILILIGDKQDYSFEIKEISEKTNIILPANTEYQKVLYKDISSDLKFQESYKNSILAEINTGEKINGIIRTQSGDDREYIFTQNLFDNYPYLDNIIREIGPENKSKYDIAKVIYINLLKHFTINDYGFYNNNFALYEGKKEVNVIELNYIYRYLLNKFGIETRGVFGYVFPIQPFKRDTFKTFSHIWTEFWDGRRWVITDPLWAFSSKNTIYFDNNNFHHIKLGNYQQENEIEYFLKITKFISITPLSEESDINSNKESISIDINNSTHLNREILLEIKNSGNQFIKIESLNIISHNRSVSTLNKDFSKRVLAPGALLKFSLPLNYGVIFYDQNLPLEVEVGYDTFDNEIQTSIIKTNTILRSNISRYITIGSFYVFIVISFISVFLITFYKRKSSKPQL